jgi:D-serine deaminase-like pyridoxal phosphate-dependent protein
MERPIFKSVGTPVLQLDTPALVVDVATLQHNITTVHGFFQSHRVKLRPHVSAHRCPVIAHKQLAAGGTTGGISVTTLGEAEVFAAHGFQHILVETAVVTPAKLRRLCALALQATPIVAVDHAENVSALATAARSQHLTLRVMVEVRCQTQTRGVAPGKPALELARLVCQADHLDFAGLTTTAEQSLAANTRDMPAAAQQWLTPLLMTRTLIEQAGFPVPTVSVNDAVPYEILAGFAGVSDIRAGAYALMDASHAQRLPQLQPAAYILTTVTSRPEPDSAIIDAGQKAVSNDRGFPLVQDRTGAEVNGLSAEHGRLRLAADATPPLHVGDKLRLLPHDIGVSSNLYDVIHAVRHDTLVAVWPVAARGYYR